MVIVTDEIVCAEMLFPFFSFDLLHISTDFISEEINYLRERINKTYISTLSHEQQLSHFIFIFVNLSVSFVVKPSTFVERDFGLLERRKVVILMAC